MIMISACFSVLRIKIIHEDRDAFLPGSLVVYGAGNGVVRFMDASSGAGIVSSAAYAGRDGMAVCAYGAPGRIVLVALFDNLGKGASGAAIQNMNIVLSREETEGLRV